MHAAANAQCSQTNKNKLKMNIGKGKKNPSPRLRQGLWWRSHFLFMPLKLDLPQGTCLKKKKQWGMGTMKSKPTGQRWYPTWAGIVPQERADSDSWEYCWVANISSWIVTRRISFPQLEERMFLFIWEEIAFCSDSARATPVQTKGFIISHCDLPTFPTQASFHTQTHSNQHQSNWAHPCS